MLNIIAINQFCMFCFVHFSRVSLMIIAQQVEGSVQCELTQLANLAVTEALRLLSGAVERDHDLTEESSARGEHVSIGEGKHIGLPVDPKESSIELANRLIAGEDEMNLCVGFAELLKTTADHTSQPFSCGSRRSSFPPDVDPSHLSAASC